METELALAAVLAVVVALLIAAQFLRIPYPILLVLGGLGLGLVPGAPEIVLEPDLVLLILLPPLLYAAAFYTPLRELRRNRRAIGTLAIGLTLATAATVAVAAHYALDFAWEPAFVLGAVVAPTDAVAATSIARRVGLPRRTVAIIEGESLINDATALVAYKAAVAAVVTGSFSLLDAGGEFVLAALGGVGVGMVVGYAIAYLRRRLDNPPVEITIALFSAYFAYLPAEAMGASGVLAAVTVAIYMGRRTPILTTPQTRIQGDAVWDIVTFLLNSTLFVLVGLQLPSVLDGIGDASTGSIVADGLLIAGVVMLTRIVMTGPIAYLPRLSRRIRERDQDFNWRSPVIVAWAGMRGAVTLAAALAIPLETDSGAAFPHRDLIIFLAFMVILVTLLLQGLTLPALARMLRIEDDGRAEKEENKARLRAAEAAIARLDELKPEDWVRDETADRMRQLYEYRLRRFTSRFKDPDGDGAAIQERSEAYQRLVREILDAQRARLVELRAAGMIDDATMRAIERDLDLEDIRLEI